MLFFSTFTLSYLKMYGLSFLRLPLLTLLFNGLLSDFSVPFAFSLPVFVFCYPFFPFRMIHSIDGLPLP